MNTTKEALELAARLTQTARQYFPKSMHNFDRFSLEQTSAAINCALVAEEERELPGAQASALLNLANRVSNEVPYGDTWPETEAAYRAVDA